MDTAKRQPVIACLLTALAALLPAALCVSDEGGCGDPAAGPCCEANGTPYCEDSDCCNLVCEHDPFCCDEDIGEWDSLCAQHAELFCSRLCGGCTADLDGNGVVDIGDILAILSAWGNKGGPEDLDGNGVVDFADILVVLAAWGPCE